MFKIVDLLMVSKIVVCATALLATATSEVKAHPALPQLSLGLHHHLAIMSLVHKAPVVDNTIHQQLINSLSTAHQASRAAETAAPYVHWLSSSAHQAELAAANARAASTAFEAAYASSISPAVIASNREHLATLARSNFLGENTPAIGITEAHYQEMWAQDAAAIYTYHHTP